MNTFNKVRKNTVIMLYDKTALRFFSYSYYTHALVSPLKEKFFGNLLVNLKSTLIYGTE